MNKLNSLHIVITIIASIILASCTYTPKVDVKLWEGSKICAAIDDNIALPANTFDSLKAGDELVIGFNHIESTEYPTISILTARGKEFPGVGFITVSKDKHEVSIFITPTVAENIKTAGISFGGLAYELTSIGIRHHETPADLGNTVWYGNVEMTDDCQTSQDLSTKSFIKAHEGDLLRISLTNIRDSASLVLTTGYSHRQHFSTTPLVNDTTTETILDHTVIETFRREGLKIGGRGYTLSKIEIIPANWQGASIINWFNHDSMKTPPEAYKDAQVGDRITICFAYTEESDWPQIAFLDDNWDDLPGTGRTLIENNMVTTHFHATQQMLDRIKQEGIRISGIGFMLKGVCVTKGKYEPWMADARYIGHVQMDLEWKAVQRICAATFADVNPGDTMRLRISNVQNGAMISLRPGDWKTFKDMEPSPLEPNTTHFDFVLDEYLLNYIKAEGCVVFGTQYTLEGMHIIRKQS